MEFTKNTVQKMIDELKESVPTPTDDDHQADWWNEPFGRKIKTEWQHMLDDLQDRIDALREIPYGGHYPNY